MKKNDFLFTLITVLYFLLSDYITKICMYKIIYNYIYIYIYIDIASIFNYI